MSPRLRILWLRCYIAARRALARKWWVLTTSELAFTEILSGALLVTLRGLIFVLGGTLNMPHDVVQLFNALGITEERWATYLMVLGILQFCYSGTRHAIIRLTLTFAIMLGFVVMVMGFVVTNRLTSTAGIEPSLVPSLICMSAFYFVLFVRVLIDMDGTRNDLGLERRR